MRVLLPLVIGVLVVLAIRLIQKLAFPLPWHLVDDLWEHMLIIRHIRECRALPHNIPEYVPGNEFYYPPLTYFVTSVFEPGTLLSHGWLINALQEASLLGGVAGLLGAWGLSPSQVGVAVGFYATVPATALAARQWSPRTMGGVLSGLALALLAFLPHDLPTTIYVTMILLLVVFSHRMSSQAVWLVGLLMAFLTRDWSWVLPSLFAEFIALGVNRRLYLQIRKSHVDVVRAYFHIFKSRPSEGRKNVRKNFVRTSAYSIGFLALLPLVGWGPTTKVTLAFLLTAYVTSVVPWLLFLGEGERYTAVAAVPSGVALALAVGRTRLWPSVLVIAVQAIVVLLLSRSKMGTHRHEAAEEYKSVAKWVLDRVGKSAVLCLPYRLNRVFAFWGVTCLQLTPSALHSIAHSLQGALGPVISGADMADPFNATRIALASKVNYIVTAPEFDLQRPNGNGEVDSFQGWRLWRLAASQSQEEEAPAY